MKYNKNTDEIRSFEYSSMSLYKLEDVDYYVEEIKVLAPKDPKASISLPERSNTPGTSYSN